MNNKNQSIFLSIIGISTLLVAIVGTTFAWFSASISGNASSMVLKQASLKTIVFEDGATINEESLSKGWSTTRSVTIATDENTTSRVTYRIVLTPSVNTYSNGDLKLQTITIPTDETTDYASVTAYTATTSTIVGTGSLGTSDSDTWVFKFSYPITNTKDKTKNNIKDERKFDAILSVETLQ